MARIRNSVDSRFKTALYTRLSREDGDDRSESNSITTQKQMLEKYILDNEDTFELYKIYSDDNYTGTNFNRPAFQEMLKDIEDGILNCVVVKDLSRFGRDYISCGNYLEKVFQKYNVRFISINDNIDSFKQAYNMMLPISNIFNQQYAVDISKKVQSAFKTLQNSGKFVGAFAGYGFIKDPKDHNKLLIDEYAAQIIRRVFDMYLEGMGKIRIAKILNEEGIVCPSEYKKLNGLNYTNSNKFDSTHYWTYSTIQRMLCNEMLIGNLCQNKTVKTMKGKAKNRPESEWIIVENTHPAIIDKATFEKVQRLLKKNTRQMNFNENISIFAGFLKCKDCGRAMAKNKRGNTVYYTCGSYKRYGSSICTPHTIKVDLIEQMTVEYINFIIEGVINLQRISQNKQNKKQNNYSYKAEIDKNQIQLNKITKLKKGIYEDYKDDILTKDEYLQYKNDYENNEEIHKNKIEYLQSKEREIKEDIFENKFLKYLIETKKITQLNRQMMAELVDYIEVGEKKELIIHWTCTDDVKELLDSISADI